MMPNGGEFLGCRRIINPTTKKPEVFIYDNGLKFRVKEAELVI